MYDILIKNGLVFNGLPEDPFQAPIAIQKGKIVKIGGEIREKEAKIVINAEGKYITPGFIDINNSADHYLGLISAPEAPNLIKQGITTIVTGNCGASLAPLVNGSLKFLYPWTRSKDINVNWNYLNEFLCLLEKRGMGVNLATLVGWNTIRTNIAGEEFKPLNKEELEKCLFLLKESLEQGAWGVSFGLGYPSEQAVGFKEIIEASKIIKKYQGLMSFHLRNERDNFLTAVEELIEISQKTNANIQISHFRVCDKSRWNDFKIALDKIENSNQQQKTNINFDIVPYESSVESLYSVIPQWLAAEGKKAMEKNLKDKKIRQNFVKILKQNRQFYKDIIVADANNNLRIKNQSLNSLAKNFGLSLEETIVKLLETEKEQILVYNKNISESNIISALQSQISMVSSNSTSINLDNPNNVAFFHQSSYGAFPKFFSYFVKSKQICSWKEAVYKTTYLPATKLGLQNKGLIKKNYDADIVVINPLTIQDETTEKNPFVFPRGIDNVIINGIVVLNKGKLSYKKAGRILRKK